MEELLVFTHLTAIVACGLSLSSSVSFADDVRDGDIVSIGARYVFAPVGFDDNDEAMVVVDGYLPSGCYRLTTPDVSVDDAAKKVTIDVRARFFDIPCIEALIPYHQELKLGVLEEGSYSVALSDGSSSETLPVAHALTVAPDDYLYAPVDSATVERGSLATYRATIRGRLTNSCMQWKELRVVDNGKTLNLLPILETTGEDCRSGEFPYEKVVDLPDSMTTGRHLLHVRSLNGQAVNHLFFKTPW